MENSEFILPKCKVVSKVIREFAERSEVGTKKYGTTLSDNPAEIIERLEHLKQEQMDATNYTQWAIEKMKALDSELRILRAENSSLVIQNTELLNEIEALKKRH